MFTRFPTKKSIFCAYVTIQLQFLVIVSEVTFISEVSKKVKNYIYFFAIHSFYYKKIVILAYIYVNKIAHFKLWTEQLCSILNSMSKSDSHKK